MNIRAMVLPPVGVRSGNSSNECRKDGEAHFDGERYGESRKERDKDDTGDEQERATRTGPSIPAARETLCASRAYLA